MRTKLKVLQHRNESRQFQINFQESTSSKSISNAPAVLDTSSIHVTIETAPKKSDGHQNGNDVSRAGNSSAGKPVMRTVELSERIQEGFGRLTIGI